MSIEKLAARLAKLPRPDGESDATSEQWLTAWREILCDLQPLDVEMLDAATSYPVVKPEDVKRGEWYWVCVAGGSILWTTWYATSNDVELLGSEFESIRGPIPRPE